MIKEHIDDTNVDLNTAILKILVYILTDYLLILCHLGDYVSMSGLL